MNRSNTWLVMALCIAIYRIGVVAGGDADTQPATQPDSASLAAIFAKLGDSDPDVRDSAQADIEEIGDAAIPLLETGEKSDDPEVQRRCRMAIAAIATPRTPTLVTLDATDAAIPALLDELARKSGQPIKLSVSDPDRLDKIKISLHARDEPFWSVLLKICGPAGLQPTGILRDGEPLRIGDGFGAWDRRFVSIHGPFALSVAMVSRTNSVLYGKVGERTSEARLTVYLQTEMRSHPLACRKMTVTRCVDGDGKPVSVIASLERPFNGSTMISGGIRLTPAPRRNAVLEGTVDYVLEGRRLRLAVQDVLKASNVQRRLGNIGLTIRECVKIGDGKWTLRVAMSRDGRTDDDWNELKIRIRDTRPHLEDADGGQIPAAPYPQTQDSADGCEIEYRLAVPRQNAQNPVIIGEPVKLVWDIPTRQRIVTVPFHFEDIPVP